MFIECSRLIKQPITLQLENNIPVKNPCISSDALRFVGDVLLAVCTGGKATALFGTIRRQYEELAVLTHGFCIIYIFRRLVRSRNIFRCLPAVKYQQD